MNIVLIGFMGTGKSAVGRALARNMDALLVDTDAEIERETGKSIPRIFAEDGEAVFRAAETSVLTRLASEPGPVIVSTGGGTPLRPENAALLQRIGAVVWLTAPPATILERVRRNLAQRPLLADFQQDPLGRIESLLQERRARYAALANLGLDTASSVGPDAVAQRIMARFCPRTTHNTRH